MRIFGVSNPEEAYPSEHRRIRGAEEMLSSIIPTPIEPSDGEAILSEHERVKNDLAEKQKAFDHYTALAEEARLHAYAELADAALEGFELWSHDKVGDA